MILDEIKLPAVEGRDVVFDLDGTIIEGDMGESVFFYLHINGLLDGKPDNPISPGSDAYKNGASGEIVGRYLRMYAAGQYDLAYQFTAEVIARYPEPQIHQAVEHILTCRNGLRELQFRLVDQNNNNPGDTVTANFGVAVRPLISQYAASFKAQGARLWIVSASPQAVVDACGRIFGFPAENLFGAVVDPESSRVERFPWKAGKARVLQEQGVQQPLLVFGNGWEDLEMLQLAVHPVVMEGGHPELVQYASSHGWSICRDRQAI